MYIRTKDSVYKALPNQDLNEEVINTEIGQFVKSEIVLMADFIEQLCDEFVIEYRDGKMFVSIHDNINDFLIEHKYEIGSGYIKNVYGAIWTEWGLKYVAKMNDRGELELI